MKAMLIGLGHIAQVHIKCLIHLNIDIAAICDIDMKKCEKAIADYGLLSAVYTDYHEMIEKEDAEMVHICTPHYLHPEMIQNCLNSGKKVFTEKPLAISRTQLDNLRTMVNKTPESVGVCFQNRFSPAVEYIKRYLQDKKIEGIIASLSWDRGFNYYAGSDWKGKKEYEGGSVLINQAIHTIDLIRYLKGEPETVICHRANDTLKEIIETEESAFVLFEYSDGTRCVLNATNTLTIYFPVIVQIKTEDKHYILITGEELFIDGKPIELVQSDLYFGKKAWGTNHLTCIRKFYEAVERNDKFQIEFEDAVKTMNLLFCCYESNGERQRVIKRS